MRKKSINKKLTLNKEIIANLKMAKVKGGKVTIGDHTCADCTFNECFSLGDGCSDYQVC